MSAGGTFASVHPSPSERCSRLPEKSEDDMPSATRIGGGLCATIAVESGLTTWGAPTGRLRTNASCGFRETTSSLTRRCRPTTLSPSRHLLRRCGRGWCTGVGMRWVVHGSLGPPPSFPANGPECRSDHSRATGHRGRYVHTGRAARDQVRTPCRGARSGTNPRVALEQPSARWLA